MAQGPFHGYYVKTLNGRLDTRVPRHLRIPQDESQVVQSQHEWLDMIRDITTRQSLVFRTVILPQGVTLSDPRLPFATLSTRRTYTLPLGYIPEFPNPTFEAEIQGSAVPPAIGPVPGKQTHYQVLPSDVVPRSEALGSEAEVATTTEVGGPPAV